MTTATKIKASFLEALGDDHTGAGAAYAALGTATTKPVESIIITTTYNNSVFLSVDGSTDHIFVPVDTAVTNTALTINFSSSKQNTGRLELPLGTQFYLKQGPDGAPTAGDLYITLIYAG
jgi:hypothetical protein